MAEGKGQVRVGLQRFTIRAKDLSTLANHFPSGFKVDKNGMVFSEATTPDWPVGGEIGQKAPVYVIESIDGPPDEKGRTLFSVKPYRGEVKGHAIYASARQRFSDGFCTTKK